MDPFAFIEDYLCDQENGMKTLITWFLNQVMLQEALQQAGAAHYERTNTRKAHRNGYKDRTLKTRYGETVLRKPQFREFPFETQVFGRYARVEKALVNAIERFLPGLMSYTAFPKRHWRRIRTTNMMERVNRELKRRTKVVGVFPNEEALLRLVGSILMDINEEWVTGRKYLTVEKE